MNSYIIELDIDNYQELKKEVLANIFKKFKNELELVNIMFI
jgi:hypothetical protein